jgi:hypothetical protein
MSVRSSSGYQVTSDRVRKNMDMFNGRMASEKKMMADKKEGCEVGRYRVCRPLQECHEVVTTEHVEKVPCDDMHMSHHGHHMDHHHGHGYSSIGWAVLWFIIIAVIVWLIVYSLRPTWALNDVNELDTGKILLASIVIALIIVIVIFVIYSACRGSWF